MTAPWWQERLLKRSTNPEKTERQRKLLSYSPPMVTFTSRQLVEADPADWMSSWYLHSHVDRTEEAGRS